MYNTYITKNYVCIKGSAMNKKNRKPLRIDIPKTVTQSVYKHLRRSIIENKLKPNQKINEQEIADIFQISRTPVREAIAQLTAEELVQVDPHHGAVVREITLREVKNILEVLRALDELAVEQAAAKISTQDVKELKNMNNKMKKASQNGEFDEYLNLNFDFHLKIWSFVPNEFLRENLRFCLIQFRRFIYTLDSYFQHPEFLNEKVKEHKEIMSILESEEKKALKSLISEHWKIETPKSSIKGSV